MNENLGDKFVAFVLFLGGRDLKEADGRSDKNDTDTPIWFHSLRLVPEVRSYL